MNIRDWVGLSVGGAVIYGLYKFVGPGSPGSKAADKVAAAIATPYATVSNWLHGSWATVPTGNVILPDGTRIALSQLSVRWDTDSGYASFTYHNDPYIIRPDPAGGPAYDVNGDYHAE
jgi:hypothetical protein